MKIIFGLVILAAAAFAAPVEDQLALPTSCEDVLAGPICDSLRATAEKIGLKAAEVENRIKEAIADGKQKAEDIREAVMAYFRSHVASLKCEDFISKERCNRMKKLVQVLGGAAEKIDEAVREAVVQGALKIQDIYNKVVEYLRKHLGKRSVEVPMFAQLDDELALPTSCEDVLAAPICESLRATAKKIGLKAAEVEKRIKEAIAEGKQKAEDIREAVIAYFKSHVATLKCEDFVSAERCNRMRKLVQILGGAAEKVDEAVREAIIQGALKIKEIYNKVIEYLRKHLIGKRSLEVSMFDDDLLLLDEMDLDDEEEFEKRNVILDVLKRKIEWLAKTFGKVLSANIDKVLNQVLTERKAEIEAIIGQGPYAVLKLALELYMKIKAMG